MATYECVTCVQHYCVNCDGGQDACEDCHTGPRCNDCAVEHKYECSGVDYCAECGRSYKDGGPDESFCRKHRGKGGPPYDAATATGMYDREDG